MKPKAEFKICSGESHNPNVAGNIDHCMICAPFWETYPVCSLCNSKLSDKGYCKKCRKHHDITE